MVGRPELLSSAWQPGILGPSCRPGAHSSTRSVARRRTGSRLQPDAPVLICTICSCCPYPHVDAAAKPFAEGRPPSHLRVQSVSYLPHRPSGAACGVLASAGACRVASLCAGLRAAVADSVCGLLDAAGTVERLLPVLLDTRHRAMGHLVCARQAVARFRCG